MSSPAQIVRRRLTQATHRIFALPILMLMPHSGCNCRCVMCDIWKANSDRRMLTEHDLSPAVAKLRELGVERVVLSGGEALLHPNLWTLCRLIEEQTGARITLLSTGLLLRKHADGIVRWCDEVTVSLDGSRAVHDRIRRVLGCFDRLADGIAELKRRRPSLRITARSVVQRQNFRDLPRVIAAARSIGLDQISFLAADVSTTAFDRSEPWDRARSEEIALTLPEVDELRELVEQVIADSAVDFASGFIAESPSKLRRIPRYYAALHGACDFPEVRCNAPWVSAVVEADGAVRPCFFHPSYGNLRDQPLDRLLNSSRAVAFRRALDVREDPICQKCVCTLSLGWRADG
jgi:MoaA/NifB/PqqE/SkfB family radical SAM enzyme